jgi:HAD superfamily hydrolase (TIGR01509 family)
MVDAAIFDMDGLMFDSEPIWTDAWKLSFGRRGLALQPGMIESFYGASRDRVLAEVRRRYHQDSNAIAAAEDHYAIARQRLLNEGAPPKEGLFELLSYLQSHHVLCAVATSSERPIAEAMLSRAEVSPSFDVIVTGDDGFPSKPAPDIFLAAAKKLGVEPSGSVVLEDSENGIRAAVAGGFMSVMVPDVVPPSDEARSLADCCCRSLLEVRDLLERGKLG